MQQEGEAGEEKMNNDQQDPRSTDGDQTIQQPQPQKCPRCDSINTKFCYYNNYSLSQPRYFCKTCRRYWTQGGTLRNVPVGGGCRKGKRTKTAGSSSSSSAGSSGETTESTQAPTMIPSNPAFFTTDNLGLMIRNKDHGGQLGGNLSTASEISSMVSYYQGALASNLTVLPGNIQSFESNVQQQQFFQMGNPNPIYPSDLQGSLIQSSRSHDHHHHHHHQLQQQQNWHQRFINNTANNPTVESDQMRIVSINGRSNVTSTSRSSGNTSTTNTSVGPPSFNPTSQWPRDLPGYFPPP